MNYRRKSTFKRGSYKKRNVKSYRKAKYSRMSSRLGQSPASSYDSGVAVKCFVTKDLTNVAAVFSSGNMFINWGSVTLAAGTTQTIRITDSTEYNSMAALYSEYTVTGVKIVVQPSQYVNPANQVADSQRFAFQMGSIPGLAMDQTTAPGTLLGAQDFGSYNSNTTAAGGIKKYINAKKYYWSRGEQYTTVGTPMSLAGTLLRAPTVNESLGTVLANVFVTYYVKFKGQKV